MLAFRSIRARLATGFSVILVGVAVIAGTSWTSNQRVGLAVDTSARAWAQIETLNLLEVEVLRLRLLAAEFQRTETAAARAPLDAALQQIDATITGMGATAVADAMLPLKTALQQLGDAIVARREAAVRVRDAGGAASASFIGIQSGAMRAGETEIAEIAGTLAEGVQHVLLGVARYQATANPVELDAVAPFVERVTAGLDVLRERTASNRRLARQVNGATQALPALVAATGSFRDTSGARISAEASLVDAARGLTDALRQARDTATAEAAASRDEVGSTLEASAATILSVSAAVVLLAVAAAILVGRAVDGPLRRLCAAMAAIAAGNASTRVPYRERRDEIGRIAEALEDLRATVARAFAQGQMLQQMPAAVMSADAKDGFRITYMNADMLRTLELVAAHLPAEPEALLGAPVEMLLAAAGAGALSYADGSALPISRQVWLGEEVLDLRISAIRDTAGDYAGPMLVWQLSTEKVRLADTFEREVGSVVEAVASSAQGLQNAAGDLSMAAEVSGREATAVAEAGGRAHADVQAVAAAADEIAGSVGEISRRVGEAADIAARAVNEARATDQVVLGLADAASRISDVVHLISGIAGQTNLLALNATIEAARAGEAGKGFAVVATEVKSLATQTARATEEIGRQITEMQAATGQAVAAIRAIGGTVERTSEIATTIAAAVEEQGAATQEIARSAAEVAKATRTVADRIGEVRRVGEATGASALGMRDSSSALAIQAALLRDKAGSFLKAVRSA